MATTKHSYGVQRCGFGVQAKLKEFLALMPRDAVAAAMEQASVPAGAL